MPIRVLAPDVAAKIAAGEVIERPASVVKELVENAIDAGATEIRVEIRGGGQREIRISDNGCGMPADEVETAFQRHATSKLRVAEDLFDVHTLGFRGEALPSIATVSHVTCVTRAASDPVGVELRLEGGAIVNRTARGGSPGTSFTIKNLFYNTPARLKFMRSEATESAHISSVIEHYALANPQIKWTLLIDGRLSLQTPGSGNLLDAIMELYGLDVARQLITVEDAAGEGEEHTRVHGYVSQPALTRSSRSSVHLFVNRRWVRASGPLVYMIEEAYHNLLMRGRHPVAILNLDVNPAAVDVNVHPTKAEVKFVQQAKVQALLGRAVRAALAEQTGIQDLVLPGVRPAETLQRRIELRQVGQRSERTGWAQPGLAFERNGGSAVLPWNASEPEADAGDSAPVRYDSVPVVEHRPLVEAAVAPAAERNVEAATPAPVPLPAPSEGAAPTRLPPLRVVGQIGQTYIVAESPDGMFLVDQHAAHERVVFERLMREQGSDAIDRQPLLLPLSVDVPPVVATLLTGHRDELLTWGFELDAFGDGTVRVRAVPNGLREDQIAPALFELADQFNDTQGQTAADRREQLLTTIACHSAVRAGQTLAHEEMRQLLQQLERCAFPRTCPHGRPTTLLISQGMLERQFGRKG